MLESGRQHRRDENKSAGTPEHSASVPHLSAALSSFSELPLRILDLVLQRIEVVLEGRARVARLVAWDMPSVLLLDRRDGETGDSVRPLRMRLALAFVLLP